MSLTYAGIDLTVPTNEQQASLQAWLDSWSDLEFSGHPWPGKDLTGLTFLPTQPFPHPRIGSLYWPFGASRWAVGHFLATDLQLALIRVALDPGNDDVTEDNPDGDGYRNSPIAGVLEMSSKATLPAIAPVVVDLFMLPARPIHQIPGMEGLNLLTLVDQRYFWWYSDSSIQPIDSTTTWLTIYGNLSDQLELDIDVDPIATAYGKPAPEFTNYYQSLPTMLDAVAYNCGQRIVCQLDGSVSAQNCATDVGTLLVNVAVLNAQGAKLLGGAFNAPSDFDRVLPRSVHNVTRVWLNEVPTVLAPLYHVADVDLLNQSGFNDATGFYNFSDIRGFDGIKTFRDTYHVDNSDFTGEQALAKQIALDYWQRIYSTYLDVTLAHPFNVEPEGLHDIEWSYTIDRASTRIYKTLWNWEPEEFLHGDGNGPFSGNSALEPFKVEPFFAQVSSPTGTAYPWTEVIPETGGSWSAKPSGRSGTDSLDPAYEFNGSTSVPPGSIVLMWRGFQNTSSTKQEWLFAVAAGGGGGELTVEDSDAMNVCTGITEIICDSNSMTVECTGPGEVTISALGTNSIYIVYQDHTLKSAPCIGGVFTAPPYSAPVIAAMKTMPGLDMTSSTNSLYTNPDSGGGMGTLVTCVPADPPPTGYYCHMNPGGNNCSTNPYPVTGDTAVIGPYPDSTTCGTACGAAPPTNKFYSETPGITWNVIQSTSEGDTGPCTVKLRADVTYPPPNQGMLVNDYIPGAGTTYPINLKDSCTNTWLVNLNPDCSTIDLTANWNGLSVYGATSCPYPDCSGTEDLLGQANGLVFSQCDFKVVDVGASCDPLRLLKVNTCGVTQNLSFSFLKPDCSTGTFSISVVDGLVKAMSVS